MNKVTITLASQRSMKIYELKRPSGQHQIHIVLGKICDLYYRGYHLSQYLDLWHGWVKVDEALDVINEMSMRFRNKLKGRISQSSYSFAFTVKLSNPIDSHVVKLIRRYDDLMVLLDALVHTGRMDESKANRIMLRQVNQLLSIFRHFMQTSPNKTHVLSLDDKPDLQLAKRSGIMPNIGRFGFGARPDVSISRNKRKTLPPQKACKEL